MFDYGYSYILFELIMFYLLTPALIIGVIVYLVRRRKRSPLLGQNKYLQIAFSREDALSQLYFLLFLAFTGVSLLAINRQMSEPFSWQTILLVVSVLALWLGYRYKLLFTAAAGSLGFISWWLAQAAAWADTYQTKGVGALSGLILLSMILYVLGHWHEQNPKWKRFAVMFIIFALVIFSGILFFLSTQYGLQAFSQLLNGGTIVASWQIMLMLIAFVVALGVLFVVTIGKNLMFVPERLAVILFTIFALLILVIPGRTLYLPTNPSMYYYGSTSDQLSQLGVYWAVLFNIGVFFEMLGIILVGYQRKESWHVTLGVVLLFILILIKYFDWFFTFLDKSLFFIGAGILMFVVGWLMERARKTVIKSMDTPKPSL